MIDEVVRNVALSESKGGRLEKRCLDAQCFIHLFCGHLQNKTRLQNTVT
jgi:hypothetical protein